MQSTASSSRAAAPAAANDAAAAPASSTHPLLHDMQAAMQAIADPAVAAGSDRYCRGVIKHRGIRSPAVDAACKQFLRDRKLAAADARQLGLALLRQPLQVRVRPA